MKKIFPLIMLLFGLNNTWSQTPWYITGNGSTTPGTHFIGTTDAQNIVFKRNNTIAGFIGTTNSSFGLNTANTFNTGSYNSSFGVDAHKNCSTGTYNTAIGYGAIANNKIGNYNTGIGSSALMFNFLSINTNSGSSNTGIGFGCGFSLTSGSNNCLMGYSAGLLLSSGNDNTLLGYNCGNDLTTGGDNTFVGINAGDGITTGSNNTIIGSNVTGLSSTLSNNIIIADGSGNQRIKVNNTGVLTIPNLAGTGTRNVVVDANGTLSAVAGSGSPTLSFTSPNLSISGGNTVDLSALKDDLGNHTATGNLNINDHTIYAVNEIEFSQSQNIYGGAFGQLTMGADIGVWMTPSYELDVAGSCRNTSGSWITSDIKFKKNVSPISNSLENLLNLDGVSYYFRKDEYPELRFREGLSYGVIAQELEKVYPEMVDTDDKGYKSVNYDMLIPVLIEAIKEQQYMLNEQNEQIHNLQNAMNSFSNSSQTMDPILFQNMPNPFEGVTQIKTIIPNWATNSEIRFYDLSGTIIETKIIGKGEQILTIDCSSYANNIYVYSLYVNNTLVDSKKMVVSKK